MSKPTQKVVEYYFETLNKYTEKLRKEKVAILMQVGDFFEIYGLTYPDGRRVGNIWEFCDNVNLKIGDKKQEVYDNPDISVCMGGVGIAYINPYIQKAVEKFGWTVVIFEQVKVGNNKFERKESQIISPGINIQSDSFSNITMIIYLEQIKNYVSSIGSIRNKSLGDNIINIGMAYVDCLTGANGIMSINNSNSSDVSIPFDELLKILTIKNPNELIIYMENCDSITNDDMINALHLFNYQFKIIREPVSENSSKLSYQSDLFNKVYVKHKGLLDINQQLDIDGPEFAYSRIALTLLLEFVLSHDKTIIEKLEKPEIIYNSEKYLMLANNSLEQLDIIDNLRSETSNKLTSKRKSLLDLLDNTRTPLGKVLLRQRLSIPITDCEELNNRYTIIGELLDLHSNYAGSLAGKNDKYGSPLHQLRNKIVNVKNIDNYLRKMITGKILPCDIGTYMDSLLHIKNTYQYIKSMVEMYNYSGNSSGKGNGKGNIKNYNNIGKLLPDINIYKNFCEIYNKFLNSMNLDALVGGMWTGIESNPFNKGVCPKLDELQAEITQDQCFLENLIIELSKIIEPSYNPETSKTFINQAENATKGIHIYTNKARKDILEEHFLNKKKTLKLGTYEITNKDIKFIQMKDSNKWEIDIIYLKTSNGTLKNNIEIMGRTVRGEMISWIQKNITSQETFLDSLNTFSRFIAEVDVLQSNVINAIENGYTCPVIDESRSENSYLVADKIRHPIIENICKGVKYVPNDVKMGIDCVNGMLLFGVNAVGKSSLMKSIGINIIMAQAGMFVAASSFIYKPYKYLFTRIRNNDNLYAGLSSFEVEMKEFKVILKYANAESIILGDELCSGTETQDATALVAAGVGQLSKRNSSFIFATHLHFLADMSYIKELTNVKLFHLLVEKDPNDPRKLIYNRKLYPGNGPKSYGILVCESMSLDEEFIEKAKEIRSSMNHKSEQSYQSITTVGSKYNKDKVITLCETCGQLASDVHHINEQCTANENGLIEHEENGIFNKNKLWNLVSLCKVCHQDVHAVPPKLKIEGYISTNKGIELKYRKIDGVIGENDVCIDDNKINNVEKKKKEVIKKENVNIEKLSSDIIDVIRNMKNNNTPKKIQIHLKEKYKISITQQAIRDVE